MENNILKPIAERVVTANILLNEAINEAPTHFRGDELDRFRLAVGIALSGINDLLLILASNNIELIPDDLKKTFSSERNNH